MKKRAITQLVFITALTLILAVFAFIPMSSIFGTYFDWQGFWGGIRYGVDVKGGVYATYKIENEENEISDKTIKDEVNKLYGQFIQAGYLEPDIKIIGNEFTIKIPNYYKDPVSGSRGILNVIENEKEIVVSSSSDFSGVDETNSLKFKDLKNVSVFLANGGYGVTVEFSNKEKLKTVSSEGTIYFYEGGESLARIPSLSVETPYQDGKLTFGSRTLPKEEADYYAMKFFANTINLTITVSDWDDAAPTLGEHTLLILGIVFGVLFVACLITLICMYRRFGLVASLALVILACLTGLFLNALPFVNLSLSGMLGLTLGTLLIIASIVYIFESIRRQLKLGKKLPTAVRFGLLKVWKILLITLSSIFVVAFGLVWIPVGGLISFMHSLLVIIPLGMITLLLIWWFIMLSLRIEGVNAKKYFTGLKIK